MTVDSEVHITGQPTPLPDTCRFVVDRPVLPDRAYFAGNAEQAERSPLAKRLFQIGCVRSVLISHDTITITKEGFDPWPVVGREIGKAIREHLASGEPAVDEKVWEELPSEDEIRERVQAVIDQQLNPALAAHGGYVRLVDVNGNRLFIELGGGCQGCGMAQVTLKQGVERVLRQHVPELGEVVDVTDHAAGQNPYVR